MHTIWVAAILIAIIVIPSFIFIRVHKRREKRDQRAILDHFEKAAARLRLSITHRQVLQDKILGLDTDKRTLLVMQYNTAQEEILVDLAQLESCKLYHEYDRVSLSGGDAKTEAVIAQMGLQLLFSNYTPFFLVCFYNNHVNSSYEIAELETTAKDWQSLIANCALKTAAQRA